VYIGASKISLPGSRSDYSALDVLGALNATDAAFAAGILSRLRNVNGVLVAGGSFNCIDCQITGNDFGIGAFTVPAATPSPSSTSLPGVPSVTLMHSVSDSTIAAKVVGIITDGSANVTASGETFELGQFAFSDALRPIVVGPPPGAVDFGGGAASSTGGNDFIGARITEIAVTRSSETIFALDDTWNPNQQRANRSGQYRRKLIFGSGSAGKNVTIVRKAVGSTVTVGPAPVPTPTPSGSPSPTASPT
jgi:hypothetical protein